MDVVDYNIGQLCYLQVKGLVNNGFYEWTFHTVFFCAFVVIDCVRKKHVLLHTFWVEPRQETLSKYVVQIVWITIEEMHHRKYRKFYKMNIEAFENLVWILTPYLNSKCVNQV